MDTVVITSRSFGSGRTDPAGFLADHALRACRGDVEHDLDVLSPVLRDAVAWIAGTAPVTEAHFSAAPKLRVLSRYGVGIDAVDLEAAARRGVTVTNTPGANSEAVADYAVAMMLWALRDIGRATPDASRGPGRELGELTVGIVGFGRIGRAVAQRAGAGFGARLVVNDPFVDDAAIDAVEAVPIPLEVLAEVADVVTLHAPGGGPPIIDGDFLAAMRPDAVLVNTARADLVDEAAVAAALHGGALGAAAFDVVDESGGPSPLRGAPRTVVTPHVAPHTIGAIDRMGMATAEDVARVLDGEPPRYPVVSA